MSWRKQFTLLVHGDAYPNSVGIPPQKLVNEPAILGRCGVIALFILILVLLLSLAMQHDFTHYRDMHQFISAGKLLVDKGLMPYKDYPFHHFPNIVFVYALLFMFTSHLTLVANLFSVTCSFIMLSLLFRYICNLLPKEQAFTGLILAVSSIITLATNDLFVFTTGWSWNHELSTLLAVLAFVSHHHAAKSIRATRWFMLSGTLLGLATGTRATSGFLLPAFIGSFIYLENSNIRQKLVALSMFSTCFLISLLPSIGLFMHAPEQFVYGNFIFRKLVVELYASQSSYQGPEVIYWALKKMQTFIDVMLLSSNIIILIILGISFFPTRKENSARKVQSTFGLNFCLAVLGFSLVGVFLTTPTMKQYYYTVVVFGVVLIAHRLAVLLNHNDLSHYRKIALIVFMSISTLLSFFTTDYKNLPIVFSPQDWMPLRIHREGNQIARVVGGGKILTFTPILALEGGLDIYAEFANGVFAWETGFLMDEDHRRNHILASSKDLSMFLESNPPRAIITGYEPDYEAMFVSHGRQNRFDQQNISTRTMLWVAPK